MSKKLILAMALSLVLVSGALFSAQADCGLNPCGWRLPSLCGFHCCSRDTDKRDLDSANNAASFATQYPSPWPPGQ